MGRIEDLATKYHNHISAPWQRNLAGEQKQIFIVYPKEDERRLRARLELFETHTLAAGYKWKSLDFTKTFARWMSETEYREIYFESPEDLRLKLSSEFPGFAADELRRMLTDEEVDSGTVVAVYGVASLYGLTKLSQVLREISQDVRGRLVLFFPGEYENGNYRLLDAHDGWNYLAIPITLHDGGQ